MIALPERHPEATRLYLVRHAAAAIEPGRWYGSLDVGLSARGHVQAQQLAKALGAVKLAAIYTSPLKRARQTSVKIARRHNLVPRELPGLMEIDFGELKGQSLEKIATTHPDTYATWMSRPTEVEFPGGESFADFTRRVRETARDVRKAHRREEVAIVSHGGPIRVIVAAALAMSRRALFRLDHSLAGVSVIDWHDGSPTVRLLNVSVASPEGERGSSIRPRRQT